MISMWCEDLTHDVASILVDSDPRVTLTPRAEVRGKSWTWSKIRCSPTRLVSSPIKIYMPRRGQGHEQLVREVLVVMGESHDGSNRKHPSPSTVATGHGRGKPLLVARPFSFKHEQEPADAALLGHFNRAMRTQEWLRQLSAAELH
jgi:hypothetical protein